MVNRIINNKLDLNFKIILAFATIYFVWGTTYLAIRLAIETIPPFLMAGIRFSVAGLLLFSWCYFNTEKKPTMSDWGKASVPGILMFVGGNGSLTWSEQFIPSGLASLVIASVPVWLVILNWLFVDKKRPETFTIIGIILGLTGVAFLFGIDNTVLIDVSNHEYSVKAGLFILTFASISWAAGSLIARKAKTSVSLPFTISMQIISGGFVLILIGSISGEWTQLSVENISLLSVISMLYLIFFGALVAYSAYVWLLRESTPAKVGTYAFFNPLVAVLLGWLYLNETLTIETLLGAALILFSILLVNRPKFKANEKINSKITQKMNKEVA